MPFAYSIHPDHGLLWNRLSGRVVSEDLDGMIGCARQDPAFDPGLVVLDDLRDVSEIDMDFNEVLSLSNRVGAMCGRGEPLVTCAIYAPSDLCYGMARMYHSLTNDLPGLNIGLFRTLPEAVAHLALSPEAAALLDAGRDPVEAPAK